MCDCFRVIPGHRPDCRYTSIAALARGARSPISIALGYDRGGSPRCVSARVYQCCCGGGWGGALLEVHPGTAEPANFFPGWKVLVVLLRGFGLCSFTSFPHDASKKSTARRPRQLNYKGPPHRVLGATQFVNAPDQFRHINEKQSRTASHRARERH